MELFYNKIDKAFTNKAIAVIQTPDGYQQDFEIKHIAGKYFYVQFNKASGGVFLIDLSKKVIWRGEWLGWSFTKTKFYYDARNQNPIDIRVLKALHQYAKHNKIPKIRRKDQKHGLMFNYKLEQLKRKKKKEQTKETEQNEQKKSEITNDEKDKILNDIQESENSELGNIKDVVVRVQDGDDPKTALEEAVTNHEITLKQGNLIYTRMQQGNKPEDIIDELAKENLVEIMEPIDMDVSMFLDDFKALEPEYTYNFLQALQNMRKDFVKLKSKKLGGGLQLGFIIMIFMILIIASFAIEPIVDNLTDFFSGGVPSIPGLGIGGGMIKYLIHIANIFH